MKSFEDLLTCMFGGAIRVLFVIGPVYVGHLYFGGWGFAAGVVFILGTSYTAGLRGL